MKKTTKYILAPILIVATFLFATIEDKAMNGRSSHKIDKYNLEGKRFVPLQFAPIKDTIYVLGDNYIEISIDNQTALLYHRDGTIDEYKVSTGTKYIHKGMETTEGIYTVQNKTPKAISRQFNNAELFHWIGFNGNIGFHGLAGNGYYGYLGVKPSSHGCVRISREDGQNLYEKVRTGTPVAVYKSEPARVLAFAESESISAYQTIIGGDGRAVNKYLQQRLENLYSGEALIKNRQKVYLDGKTILRHARIQTGRSENIAARQLLPLHNTEFDIAKSDNLKFSGAFILNDEFGVADE